MPRSVSNLPPARGRVARVLTGDERAYLAELTVAGRAPTTIKLRRLQIAGWLAWLAGQGLSPYTATRGDAVTYLAMFAEGETRGSYRAALRGYHAWLLDTGRAESDPCERLPSVRRKPGMPHPIPDDVLLEVLATCTPHMRDMLMLGRFAGLRAAEIAAAHSDYLRGTPPRQTIRLRGKGSRVRELPAHPEVVRVLASRRGYVFPSGRDHIRAHTVSTEVADLLPDPWSCHSLRHAFATEAFRRTGNLALVQAWMGHASPVTTMRYIQLDQDWEAMGTLRLVAS